MVNPQNTTPANAQERTQEQDLLSSLLARPYRPEVEKSPAKVEAPAPAEAPAPQPPAPPREEPLVEIKGDTYPIKESLKAMGGQWDPFKKLWRVPKSREREALQLLLARVESARRSVEAAAKFRQVRRTVGSTSAVEYYKRREEERAARAKAAVESRPAPTPEQRAPVEWVRVTNPRNPGKYVEISICAICGELKCAHPERRIIRVEV